jgi:uncharacterized protein involved in exopolysaccharide biosynthesis
VFQEEVHLTNYLRIIRKRQWVIITFFVILVVSVTISSFLSAPIYKATARILIEKETPNVLSFKEVLALDTADTDYYQTQYTILKSRTLAKQVLQELGIMEQAISNQSQSFSIRGLFTGILNVLRTSSGRRQRELHRSRTGNPCRQYAGGYVYRTKS